MNQTVAHYLLQQHCSAQWRFFLQAFADVCSRSLSADECRGLMRDIGARAADLLGLQPQDNLSAFEEQLNQAWEDLRWGVVEFRERDEHLEILHSASPLETACGTPGNAWTGGFLEGLYDSLFHMLGAGEELQVTQAPSNDSSHLVYILSRRPEQ